MNSYESLIHEYYEISQNHKVILSHIRYLEHQIDTAQLKIQRARTRSQRRKVNIYLRKIQYFQYILTKFNNKIAIYNLLIEVIRF
jgi:hypothetical protein